MERGPPTIGRYIDLGLLIQQISDDVKRARGGSPVQRGAPVLSGTICLDMFDEHDMSRTTSGALRSLESWERMDRRRPVCSVTYHAMVCLSVFLSHSEAPLALAKNSEQERAYG